MVRIPTSFGKKRIPGIPFRLALMSLQVYVSICPVHILFNVHNNDMDTAKQALLTRDLYRKKHSSNYSCPAGQRQKQMLQSEPQRTIHPDNRYDISRQKKLYRQHENVFKENLQLYKHRSWWWWCPREQAYW